MRKKNIPGKLKKTILALGIILFISLVFIPPPAGLTAEGARSLAVFCLCISLWVTNYIPLGITSLLGMALIPFLGIMSAGDAFSFFGDKALFFILGALMLAAALYKTGLGTRIAFFLMSRFDKKPSRIIAGIMATAAILSCIMPEHAVAAMLFPIVFEVARSLDLKPLKSNMGKALFLALAWGAIIGGITTYLGGARNLLAVGLLERTHGLSIGFLEWIKYAFPIPFIILIIGYFLLIYFFKPEIEDAEAAYNNLLQKTKSMGHLSVEEKRLAIVLVTVIITWLFFSNLVHISVTALLGGVIIFLVKVIDWKDMVDYVNWGVILMYGGAIVVATSLAETGATLWLADKMLLHMPLNSLLFIIVIALFTKGITEGISNVAAVAIVLPIAFSAGSALSVNPVVTTMIVALSGGLAFCLPMGTPPNAIAFSSGFYKISEVVKAGIILNIISIIVIVLVAKYYWPLVNLELIIK